MLPVRNSHKAALNPYSTKLSEFPEIAWDQHDQASMEIRVREGWLPIFPNSRQRVVEIGCSNGMFLADIAAKNPELAFLGLDWKFKNIYKAAKRVSDAGLVNAKFLRAKAQEVWPALFANKPDGSARHEWDQAWIFFPDPWPKKSQYKHRIFAPEFLSLLHRSLAKGGTVHFKTDHPGYFQWALALFGVRDDKALEQSLQDGLYQGVTQPGVKSKSQRQFLFRLLEQDPDALPKPSAEVLSQFKLDAYSFDYWNDPKIKTQRGRALYGSTPTLFEKLFLKDGLPIFYLEISKK